MKLKIAICQSFPRLGDFSHNMASHAAMVKKYEDCDVVCFPELSATGYFVKDLAYDLALTREEFSNELNALTSYKTMKPSVIAGFSERASGLIYNSLFVGSGSESYSHRKIYPPTYGIFDEYRYFACGEQINPFMLKNGVSIGVLNCEDASGPSVYLFDVRHRPSLHLRGVPGPRRFRKFRRVALEREALAEADIGVRPSLRALHRLREPRRHRGRN